MRGADRGPVRRQVSRVACAVAVVAASMLAVAAAPATARAAATAANDQVDDRIIDEFGAVLDLRSAPDSTCLTVYRDHRRIVNTKGDEPLVPASLAKIAVATAALEVIGPDTVYTTRLFARSDALASVSGGVLRGDLYLLGGGDPVLSHPAYIARWSESKPYTDVTSLADRVFASLRARGVTRIEGAVVGDESRYPDLERDYTDVVPAGETEPLWKKSWVTSNLVGPLSALMLNDGYSSYSASTGSAGRRANVRAVDPALHAASDFDDLLEARGMVITRRPRSGSAPLSSQRVSLGSVDSPPMSQIVLRVLSRSDNTTAEMVLKEIGHRSGGSTRVKSAEAVMAVLRRVLGSDADDLVVSDGSGLSYYNRMTCSAIAKLLQRAGARSPLVAGLSIAGQRGTLRNCGPVAPPASQGRANTVRAKTGTLDHATGLAGVATSSSGSSVTFAMIANETNIIRIGFCNSLQKALLNAAAQYTYGPAPDDNDSPPDSDDDADDSPSDDAAPGAPAVFTDISGSVHAGAIGAVAAAGITRGCSADGSRFCPDDAVSRAEMAAFLARALGLGNSGGSVLFVDVAGSVHAGAIGAVAAAGITRGCSADGSRFCPDDAVSRAEMAAFLARALGLGNSGGSVLFNDISGSVHAGAIGAVAAAGITRGCSADGSRFCPDDDVTRAEMAAFLARALRL